MNAQSVFDEFLDQGWNDDSKLSLFVRFIEQNKLIDDFKKFLEECADEEKSFEMNIDREESKNKPHFQVEYDLNYYGGDYDKVGKFVYIPKDLIDVYGSPERAFEKVTGKDSCHIVHFSLDEIYDSEGNELNEDA